MEFIRRSILLAAEKNEVFDLWNNEYPEKLAFDSIEKFETYLNGLTEQTHLLLVDAEQRVKGWYVDFKRDDEKWFALILHSKHQGKGLGTKMLEIAKQKENELKGWVIDHNNDKKKNGQCYISPLNFYLKSGFIALAADRLELDKISAVKIKWNNTLVTRDPKSE